MAPLATTLADPLWNQMTSGCKKDDQDFDILDKSPWQTTALFLDFPGGGRVPSEIYKHIHNKWEAEV